MEFLPEYWLSWLPYLLAFLIGGVTALYVYITHSHTYWSKLDVPYFKPSSIFGNLKKSFLMKVHMGEELKELYFKAANHKFFGLYSLVKPILMIRDPELIKTFLVKNFSHFHDQAFGVDENVDPLFAKNLFAARGLKWRSLRVRLTPIFTSGKLKRMFSFMVDSGQELNRFVEARALGEEIVEVKEVLTKFTTDVIGSCAFGIQCNSMKGEISEFQKMGQKTFQPSLKNGLNSVLRFLNPSLADSLKLRFVPEDVTNFFRKLVKETMEYREKNNVQRNDLIDLLMQIKKKGYIDDEDEESENREDIGEELNGKLSSAKEFSHDDITAQAVVFFLGGFEPTSNTMTYALHELAVNQNVQKRLREEIDQVLERRKDVTYEAVQEMEYLDMVVSETLRKYSSAPFLTRECTKDFTIPDTKTTVQKGTKVFIPVAGLHYDPKYYPEPEKFEPERFTEKNKSKRPPYTYLPFGEGPRMCIGNRFALLQSKVGLVCLLRSYEFRTCSRTKIPPKISPRSISYAPEDGVWLQIVKRRS